MIPGKSDEENIKEMMHVLQVSEDEARFILAIEKGEIDGDVVEEEPLSDVKPQPQSPN